VARRRLGKARAGGKPIQKKKKDKKIGEIEGGSKIINPKAIDMRPKRPEMKTKLSGQEKHEKEKEDRRKVSLI